MTRFSEMTEFENIICCVVETVDMKNAQPFCELLEVFEESGVNGAFIENEIGDLWSEVSNNFDRVGRDTTNFSCRVGASTLETKLFEIFGCLLQSEFDLIKI